MRQGSDELVTIPFRASNTTLDCHAAITSGLLVAAKLLASVRRAQNRSHISAIGHTENKKIIQVYRPNLPAFDHLGLFYFWLCSFGTQPVAYSSPCVCVLDCVYALDYVSSLACGVCYTDYFFGLNVIILRRYPEVTFGTFGYLVLQLGPDMHV